MGVSGSKFLDLMVEDGRDYLVYAKYSLLNFPS